jgi:membrane protease YdiL (CAAX protease family)
MRETDLDVASVNWKQVWIFVGLTFGLTYLLDLVWYLTVGYSLTVETTLLAQVQMLIPATVAIVLQVFVFKNSPIYRLQGRIRWFFYGYLAYALLHISLAASVVLVSNEAFKTLSSLLVQLLLVCGLIALAVLRLVSGKEAFHRVGLRGGRFWYYLAFGLLILGIYGLMTALNALFGLGQSVDAQEFMTQAVGGQAAGLDAIPDWVLLLLVGIQSIILGPLLGLPVAFGEEYGWRGYLQGELIKTGKVRGILLLGIIWGLWHAPLIVMGHNYPGYPVLGPILMTLYTIGLAFVLGFAVLRSGSVWLAAFLHALNNQVVAFLMIMIYTPDDPVLSFGIGAYGLIIWALLIGALLLLGRREWTAPILTQPQRETAG